MGRTLQGAVDSDRSVVALRRPWWSHVSAGHALIAIVGVLAFLLNLAVLRGATRSELFAVAARDIPSGARLTPDLVRFVELSGPPELTSRLIGEADIETEAGSVFAHPISSGDPIPHAVLIGPASVDGHRAMSIPIGVEHAAGGRIVAGDRVDVVAVDAGVGRFVASDLEVISVPESTRGALGSSGTYFVVVSVDADTALELATALADQDLEVIQATGAAG